MATLDIGKSFSKDPQGRFRSDSESSGEAFREDVLLPALRSLPEDEVLNIILDNDVESYGSSFLTEGFAGVIKYGYFKADEILPRMSFSYTNPDFSFFEQKVRQYCKEAKFNSKKYIPSQRRR